MEIRRHQERQQEMEELNHQEKQKQQDKEDLKYLYINKIKYVEPSFQSINVILSLSK